MKARLLTIAVTLALFAGAVAAVGRPHLVGRALAPRRILRHLHSGAECARQRQFSRSSCALLRRPRCGGSEPAADDGSRGVPALRLAGGALARARRGRRDRRPGRPITPRARTASRSSSSTSSRGSSSGADRPRLGGARPRAEAVSPHDGAQRADRRSGRRSSRRSRLYVTSLDLPSPGKYWMLAEPVGAGRRIQALGNVVVQKRSDAPERAATVRSRPTRRRWRAPAATSQRLTTSKPARPRALPAFRSRTLSRPTFRSSSPSRRRSFARRGHAAPSSTSSRRCASGWPARRCRFINVEIYEDNDPAKGTNRWVNEWRLPTEPFTFVVDGRGIVRSKLEGAFSVRELEAAVRRIL